MNNAKVITANLLIDGQGGAPIEKGAIVLEGSKISWVGAQKDLPRRDGPEPETLDFPSGTILPGLVDVHTHTNLPGDGTAVEEGCDEPDEMLMLRSAWNARKHLETGVTTARDNGGKNMTTIYLRKGIERGFIPGPRMVVSGRPNHRHRRALLGDGRGGRRRRGRPHGGAPAVEGRGGLHQGDDHGRRDKDFVSDASVLRAGRTESHHLREPSFRQAGRRALLIYAGDHQLAGRRRGHAYPLHLLQPGRVLHLRPGGGGAHRGGGRVDQPDAARGHGDPVGAGGEATGERAEPRGGGSAGDDQAQAGVAAGQLPEAGGHRGQDGVRARTPAGATTPWVCSSGR